MEEEILTGGRVTAQVVRRGGVCPPHPPARTPPLSTRCWSSWRREAWRASPATGGWTSRGGRCSPSCRGRCRRTWAFSPRRSAARAVERMKAFHSCLRDFPGCPPWLDCVPQRFVPPATTCSRRVGRCASSIGTPPPLATPWTTWPTPCGCGWIWAMRSTATPQSGSAWASCWTPTAWPPGRQSSAA